MYQFNQNQIVNIPQKHRPRLALTIGDPAGIGSEVILKALADSAVSRNCDLTLLGNRNLLLETHKQLSSTENSASLANPALLKLIDVPVNKEITDQIILGTGNAASGAASFAYMEYAIAQTLAGKFDGIVTGPIAKSAWKSAGYNYPGQTELLAQKAGIDRFGMLFVARSLILVGYSELY